jgi:hypothetical protein
MTTTSLAVRVGVLVLGLGSTYGDPERGFAGGYCT